MLAYNPQWMHHPSCQGSIDFYIDFIPQIAIAIGVLTSNRGEGDEPLWRIGHGTRVPLQGAVDVVPLLGVIVGCHCSVLLLGQLWGSGRSAIAGCHFCFISSSYIQGHQFHPETQENNNEFCVELLANATLFSTLITQKLVLAIWGLCWYNLCLFMLYICIYVCFLPQKINVKICMFWIGLKQITENRWYLFMLFGSMLVVFISFDLF